MDALRIDRMLFLMAFERDVDYEHSWQEAYLDLVSGSVEWLFEEDENAELFGISATDNEAQRNRISGDSNKFLLIPGLSHHDHHDILRSFLASNWTDDDRQQKLPRMRIPDQLAAGRKQSPIRMSSGPISSSAIRKLLNWRKNF